MTHQSASNRRRYRFGEFVLDPMARELRRAGALLSLSPKVFDCIAYLIERNDRAIGRDELIAAVWGRADVADAQLRHLIRKVRRAVGDSGDGQIVIHTISGFGFRWVAKVNVVEVPQDAKTELDESPSGDPLAVPNSDFVRGPASSYPAGFSSRLHSNKTLVVLFIAFSLAGAYVWSFPYGRRSSAAATSSAASAQSPPMGNTIAVLPVDVGTTGNSDIAWMRLGLMDLIANQLRSATLAVVPSSDIVALTRDDKMGESSAARVRAATGAQNVIAVFLNRTGDGWTLHLELRASDGSSRVVKVHSADAILAAREAADRVLELLGRRRPTNDGEISELSAIELTQRIEAALLVDDFGSARHLLESAAPSLLAMPELQLDAARVEIAAGNTETARKQLENALANSSAEASPVFRAQVLNRLGVVDYYGGKIDLAEQRFTESVTLLQNRDEPTVSGQAYARRGAIKLVQNSFDDAQGDFARARTAFSLAGNTRDLAVVELNEGTLEARRRRPAEALDLFERAVEHSEHFGSSVTLVHALGNEISAYLDLLQTVKALAVSNRVDRELARMDESPDLRIVRSQQIPALLKNGRVKSARDRLNELERVMDPVGEAEDLSGVLGFQAELDLSSGQWESAADRADRAIGPSSAHGDDGMRSRNWLTKIRALRALHRDAQIEAEMQHFSDWAREHDSPNVTLHMRLAEAEQASAQGQWRVADQYYEEALSAAHGGGVPVDVAEVATAFGDALIGKGELDQASTVVGQIAIWGDTDFDCAVLQARLYHALGSAEAWDIALRQARQLAGERPLPSELTVPPPRQSVAVAQRH